MSDVNGTTMSLPLNPGLMSHAKGQAPRGNINTSLSSSLRKVSDLSFADAVKAVLTAYVKVVSASLIGQHLNVGICKSVGVKVTAYVKVMSVRGCRHKSDCGHIKCGPAV